jgi:hypothetical protein
LGNATEEALEFKKEKIKYFNNHFYVIDIAVIVAQYYTF